MTTESLLSLIGQPTDYKVIAGRYGDARLYSGGYLAADPCYVFGTPDYLELCAAAREQHPDAYSGRVREWRAFNWRGVPCYFISCGDGLGPLNLCVDAGWVGVFPLCVVPSTITDLFLPHEPHPH